MKKTINLSTILILSLTFASCFSDKCDDDVLIGEYPLTIETELNWLPWLDQQTLTFKNDMDEELVLNLYDYRYDYIEQGISEICNEGPGDTSVEYYTGEAHYFAFTGDLAGISYLVESLVYVANSDTIGNVNLYDQVGYSVSVSGLNPQNRITSTLFVMSDSRGNTIPAAILNPVGHSFETEVLLDEVTYEEVWTYTKNEEITLWAQKSQGVIAFRGFDDEIWIMQE